MPDLVATGVDGLRAKRSNIFLGCSEIDQETRNLLWRSKGSGGGFEDTLANLASAKDAEGKKRYNDLTAALVGMFNVWVKALRSGNHWSFKLTFTTK